MGLIQGTVSQNSDRLRSYIYWEERNVDVNNNQSDVYVEILIDNSSPGYDWNGTVRDFNLNINGTVWNPADFNSNSDSGWTYSSSTSPTGRTAERIYSATLSNIDHNSDGSKSISISCSFSLPSGGWGPGDVSISGNATLTTIPRASTVTSFPDHNIDGSFTVQISRHSSAFTHSLYFYVDGYIVAERHDVATSILVDFTTTEENKIYEKIPNNTSVEIGIQLHTWNGSVLVGDTSWTFATASVSSSIKPTFSSLTHSEAVANLATQFAAYVQGKSQINLAINGATGAKYSTIKSYKITLDGHTINASSGTTGIMANAGTKTATATITDSRGRTNSASIDITVVAYAAPRITSLSVIRCNSDGTANESGDHSKVTVEGTYSSVNGKNTKLLTVQSKTRSESSFTTKATDLPSSSFTYSVVLSGYDTATSYDFKAILADYFTSVNSTATIATAKVILNLGKDGVGVGKFWESGALDVAGDIYMNGQLVNAGTGIISTELSSSQNLNDITTAGFYYQTATADTPGNNYPTDQAGSLLVQKSAGGVTQLYITFDDGDVYTRTYYQSWSGWKHVSANTWRGISDSVTSTSSSTSASSKAVKTAYDLAAGKAAASHSHSGQEITPLRIECGYNHNTDNSIGCSAWFRSINATGWYNATYGGGIYMADTTYVRTYNSKKFYAPAYVFDGGTNRYILADVNDTNTGLYWNNSEKSIKFIRDGLIALRVTTTRSASTRYVQIHPAWSGSSGTEPCIYPSTTGGWGFVGGSGQPWYRIYGSGGSVSDRNKKYNVSQYNDEDAYEAIKFAKVYSYSTKKFDVEKDEEGNPIEGGATFEVEGHRDYSLGAMAQELPPEVLDYFEGRVDDGTAGRIVNPYGYASLVAGATRHLITQVEQLKEEKQQIRDQLDEILNRLAQGGL